MGDGRGPAHPLGTDTLGRDVLSRLLYGARVSLVIGLIAVVLAGAAGVALGLIAGYYRGRLDDVLMRVGDIQLAFPVLLLGVALLSVLGASLGNLIAVLALSGWVTYARIVRGETLSLAEREFVAAARALGARDGHVIRRHILVERLAADHRRRDVFRGPRDHRRGLTVVPRPRHPAPSPKLGRDARRGAQLPHHGLVARPVPGPAILAVVLGINLVGDWLRDLLDPRLERGM